jgi:outer membrane protein OmpA-like peptidoglycan-associated protein
MSQDARVTDVVRAGDKPTLAPARFPFLPWGLAPLVGLGLVLVAAIFPFAVGEIEASTSAATRKALQDGGYGWVNASVSGQWVTLEGKPPSREEADKVIAAVSRARAPTFFGEAEPATWIIDRFTWTEDPLNPLGEAPPQSGPATTPATPGTQANPSPPPTVAEQRCDQSMADLLGGATIEFATNSAVIRTASASLLDGIARAAKACPGRLRIEGHTDNVGRDGVNTTLSLRRAEAVRTALIRRGVEASRLVAEGFGAAKPVATNETDAGRARNRRIEIRAVGASPN